MLIVATVALSMVYAIQTGRLGRRNREQADTFAYARSIATAQLALDQHNSNLAATILASCPEALRGWEWDYLDRLSRPFERSIPSRAQRIGFDPRSGNLVEFLVNPNPPRADRPGWNALGFDAVWRDIATGSPVRRMHARGGGPGQGIPSYVVLPDDGAPPAIAVSPHDDAEELRAVGLLAGHEFKPLFWEMPSVEGRNNPPYFAIGGQLSRAPGGLALRVLAVEDAPTGEQIQLEIRDLEAGRPARIGRIKGRKDQPPDGAMILHQPALPDGSRLEDFCDLNVDGSMLAWRAMAPGDPRPRVTVFRTADWTPAYEVKTAEQQPNFARFLPDGKSLLAAEADVEGQPAPGQDRLLRTMLCLRDASTGALRADLGDFGDPMLSPAIVRATKRILAIADFAENQEIRVRAWSLPDGALLWSERYPQSQKDWEPMMSIVLALDPKADRIAIDSGQKTIVVRDLRSGQARTFEGHGTNRELANDLAFDPLTDRLVACDGRRLTIWNLGLATADEGDQTGKATFPPANLGWIFGGLVSLPPEATLVPAEGANVAPTGTRAVEVPPERTAIAEVDMASLRLGHQHPLGSRRGLRQSARRPAGPGHFPHGEERHLL